MYNTATATSNNFKMPASKNMYSTRSRSPIVIVYDNEDYDNLNIDYNKNNSINDLNGTNNSNNSNYLHEQSANKFYTIQNENNDLNLKNYNYFNANILKSPNNYESISETNTPIKYIEDMQLKTPINLTSDSKSNQIKSISSTSLQHLSNKNNNAKISYV
jgi:hypothetical protein